MKVSSINLNSVNIYKNLPSKREDLTSETKEFQTAKTLIGMPYVYPITFGGMQYSSKLRTLFEYNLPCMYSGVEMIDPKAVARLLKNGLFRRPVSECVPQLKKYKKSMSGIEASVFELIEQRAKVQPNMNIQGILHGLEHVYRKDLYKKQAPIFHELKLEFDKLPSEYSEQFAQLMQETELRLSKHPIYKPFSPTEFKYKLAKAINNLELKPQKVINQLRKESKRLYPHTTPETIEHQRNTINTIDWILSKSSLKNNAELNELISSSKTRLKEEETVIPFSRKSFIYDTIKIVKSLNDRELEHKLLSIAQKLPTSNQDLSAYVLKYASEPCDKIGFRLLWPSMASVEHIHPRSCGGLDIMANFGGATARENSARKSIDFVEQIKLRPDTPKNCQKYVDRLIEMYHQGIFAKHGVNPQYIEDFKNTIYRESQGQIDLDVSKMYTIP